MQRKRKLGGKDGDGIRKDLAVIKEGERSIPDAVKGVAFAMTQCPKLRRGGKRGFPDNDLI